MKTTRAHTCITSCTEYSVVRWRGSERDVSIIELVAFADDKR